MKAIKIMIRQLDEIIESRMPAITREVDRMIVERETSAQNIEYMLDTLLSLAYMGKGEEEFKRLTRYYSGISREAARDYRRYYREINEDSKS